MSHFEYTDIDGDQLMVTPWPAGGPGPVVGLIIMRSNGKSCGCFIPVDRVEEVVAGIRDAARQAAGQPAAAEHAPAAEEPQDHPAAALYFLLRKAGEDRDTAQQLIYAHAAMAVRQHEALNGTTTAAAGQPDTQQPADLLADCATEYHVPVPEGGGTNLLVRRQALVHGTGWAVSTRGYGGGRAWTTEGWQKSISALSVDRLFCWPDAATAVDEARRALEAAR